ncbi:MAG: alpha/beta hydrolase [Verrucomicrobiae bacterium]|nr:alpha/beta hydrolase [Verrucomicrobiae bacterium]
MNTLFIQPDSAARRAGGNEFPTGGVFTLFLFLLLAPAARAESTGLTKGETEFLDYVGRPCPVIRLWPEGKVPDEPRPLPPESVTTEGRGGGPVFMIRSVSDPSMVILSPPEEKNTGVALVLAPGGGYGGLGADLVKEVGEWLNRRGITCVLLKYRVPKRHQGYDMHFQPLQDAQRAMGILRSRAVEFGIDPEKIGFGGASAGGNLAACLLMNHAERWYRPVDDLDKTRCRPDFGLLLYPAYLTDPIVSRNRVAKLGFDKINARDTPPTLTTICFADKFTFGSAEIYLAMRRANVPAEFHVYPVGGHGGGVAQYPFGQWADEFVRFLARQKFLREAPAANDAIPEAATGAKVHFDGGGAILLRPSSAPNSKTVVVCPDPSEPSSHSRAVRFATWLGTHGFTSLVIDPDETAAEIGIAMEAALDFSNLKASEWGTNEVGLCGFGNAARPVALAAAQAKRLRQNTDPVTFIHRPAFAILVSPRGLSPDPDTGLTALRPTSPPILILSSGNDPEIGQTADYYLKIEPTRVHAECHVYEAPGALDMESASDWGTATARWLNDLDAKD